MLHGGSYFGFLAQKIIQDARGSAGRPEGGRNKMQAPPLLGV